MGCKSENRCNSKYQYKPKEAVSVTALEMNWLQGRQGPTLESSVAVWKGFLEVFENTIHPVTISG